MHKSFILLVSFVCTSTALAQQTGPDAVAVNEGPHFFSALVGGIFLAVAIQMVITTFIAASNVMPTHLLPPRRKADHTRNDFGMAPSIQVFNQAYGLWAMVSMMVSLFMASFFAIKLSMTADMFYAAMLGLTIWSGIYVLLIFRPAAINSIAGSLLSIVIANIRTGHENTVTAFTRPEERKIIDSAEKVAADVQDRMQGDVDIREQLQQYIKKLEPRLDPKQIAKEMPNLFTEAETQAIVEFGPLMDHDAIIASLHTEDGFSKEHAEALATAIEDSFSIIKQQHVVQRIPSSKITSEAAKMAGMITSDAREFRKKVEHYLRTTQKTQLDTEHMREDFEKFLNESKGTLRMKKARSDQLDKSSVLAVLSQREDLSEDETKQIIDQVIRVLQQLKSKTHSALQNAKISALAKFRNYLGGLGRHELRYEDISQDVRLLFNNPQHTPDSLIRRLKSIDDDLIAGIVKSRRDITVADANEVIVKIKDAREEIVKRAHDMKIEIRNRIEETRRDNQRKADSLRRTLARITWWTFGTAVVSGIAAVAGAVIAA